MLPYASMSFGLARYVARKARPRRAPLWKVASLTKDRDPQMGLTLSELASALGLKYLQGCQFWRLSDRLQRGMIKEE